MRLLLLLLLATPAWAGPAEDWCRKIEAQVAESGEYGPLWVNEVRINSRNRPWPVVGAYRQTYRFFYDRQESYPDRLRCVEIEADVSDRSYAETLIYDEQGRLVRYRSQSAVLLWWGGKFLSGPATERQRVEKWAASLRKQFLAELRFDAFH